MTRLLVSVRSAAEAEAALAGGAALIDVKEPVRGALGRADDPVIADVVRAVAGRAPVSAALGELRDTANADLPSCLSSLTYVKCGLAGCAGDEENGWRSEMDALADRVRQGNPLCKTAVVAYADWRRARAPMPDAVWSFAGRRPGWGFLLDTWGKDGLTLLDWISRTEVDRLCRVCRDAGVQVALAGSLTRSLILSLRTAAPDWFAVRGAGCQGLQRTGAIDAAKVRGLADLLTDSTPES